MGNLNSRTQGKIKKLLRKLKRKLGILMLCSMDLVDTGAHNKKDKATKDENWRKHNGLIVIIRI